MNQRVAHINLDAMNTLVVPTPKTLHLRIPLPEFLLEPVRYECIHAGRTHKGNLGSDGKVSISLECQLGEALFRVWLLPEDEEPIEWQLETGLLADADELLGIQGRLNNLGIDPGPLDGVMGQRTRNAILYFQEQQGLAVTGEPDDATKTRLVNVYGC